MSDETADRWNRVAEDYNRSRMGNRLTNLEALNLADKYRIDQSTDLITSAEHDQIWLALSEEEIASIPDDDIGKLYDGGVHYDSDYERLSMYI